MMFLSTMATNTIEEENCHILLLTEESKDIGIKTANAQNGSKMDSPDLAYVDHMDISDPFTPCVVTLDIEKGGALTKTLRRQKSLDTEGVPIPLLMNHILMLLKFDAKEKQGLERSHDGANNRWRKCKRSNFFDSRQIVIVFSILSSIGTLVLIYLTLRVRQVSDGFYHC
ncbi:hypothetical protein RND81_06G028600 [Saponaria officinalis]|uniref:Uncharacterized protein n=1 Tax=Saponaria officinalis TaxID=3572 RepID=A0AAW1K3V7_SAPOF